MTYQGGLQGVTIQFDTNGDGTPDASTATDSYGQFQYVPTGLSDGAVTIDVRTAVVDTETRQQLYGGWVPLSFTYTQPAASSPVVSGLALAASTTDSSGNQQASDPTVIGQVTGVPFAGGAKVEFQVNGTVVGSTLADSQGSFSYTPSGLAAGSVSIEARATTEDASGNAVVGSWTAPLSFKFQLPAPMPNVNSLTLVMGGSQPATALLTSYAAVQGTIGGTTAAGVTVQFDTNDDGQPDGTAVTDNKGHFAYYPSALASGLVSIQARTMVTAADGSVTYGDWQPLEFILSYNPADTKAQAEAAALAQEVSLTSAAAALDAGTTSTAQSNAATLETAAALQLESLLGQAASTDSTASAAATQAYTVTAAAADNLYNSAISTGASTYAQSLASYSGDTTSYNVSDFQWPSSLPPCRRKALTNRRRPCRRPATAVPRSTSRKIRATRRAWPSPRPITTRQS